VGFLAGLLVALRLLSLVLLSAIFTSTTAILRLKSAVERLFRPVPLVAETRLAAMVGLAISFVPLVSAEIGRIDRAQRARCVENRRNPLVRLAALGLASLRRVLDRADTVVLAMEARCYTGKATPEAGMLIRGSDWIALAAVTVFCGGLIAAEAVL
jgi:energy-coupling factor transporter transmembrane protein EcfT